MKAYLDQLKKYLTMEKLDLLQVRDGMILAYVIVSRLNQLQGRPGTGLQQDPEGLQEHIRGFLSAIFWERGYDFERPSLDQLMEVRLMLDGMTQLYNLPEPIQNLAAEMVGLLQGKASGKVAALSPELIEVLESNPEPAGSGAVQASGVVKADEQDLNVLLSDLAPWPEVRPESTPASGAGVSGEEKISESVLETEGAAPEITDAEEPGNETKSEPVEEAGISEPEAEIIFFPNASPAPEPAPEGTAAPAAGDKRRSRKKKEGPPVRAKRKRKIQKELRIDLASIEVPPEYMPDGEPTSVSPEGAGFSSPEHGEPEAALPVSPAEEAPGKEPAPRPEDAPEVFPDFSPARAEEPAPADAEPSREIFAEEFREPAGLATPAAEVGQSDAPAYRVNLEGEVRAEAEAGAAEIKPAGMPLLESFGNGEAAEAQAEAASSRLSALEQFAAPREKDARSSLGWILAVLFGTLAGAAGAFFTVNSYWEQTKRELRQTRQTLETVKVELFEQKEKVTQQQKKTQYPPQPPRVIPAGKQVLLYWLDNAGVRTYNLFQRNANGKPWIKINPQPLAENLFRLPAGQKGTWEFAVSAFDYRNQETEKSESLKVKLPLKK